MSNQVSIRRIRGVEENFQVAFTNFEPLFSAFSMYRHTALRSVSNLKEVANKWAEVTVKEQKKQKTGSVAAASTSLVSLVALGASAFLTGPFLAVGAVAGGVSAEIAACKMYLNHKLEELTKETWSEVKRINDQLKDALDEIKHCVEDLVGEQTSEVESLDRLLAKITSDIQFKENMPKIRVLRNLIAKIQEDSNASLFKHIKVAAGYLQSNDAFLGIPAVTLQLASTFKHSSFDFQCNSEPRNSSSLQCLSRTGKFVYSMAFIVNAFAVVVNANEARDLSEKLKEIERLPKEEQAKAAGSLSKEIMEEAERIEEGIRIQFKGWL